ncbi:MAG: hypothetical protein PVI78_06595 [Anaerolineales bacterium]
MIRPFDWRDLMLLHRVRKHGICLDAQMGFTRGPNTLWNALMEIVPTGRSVCTLVYRPEDKHERAAIGQISHRPDEPHARVAFIGPAGALSSDNSIHLLDALVEAAGVSGAHHLIAEVKEESRAFENLRRAGFSIFARQRIWRLNENLDEGGDAAKDTWRGIRDDDHPAVQMLYHSLVPPLVQQIEPPPSNQRGCLVHCRDGEMLGYLQVLSGPLGTWAQPFLHPAVEASEYLLRKAISQSLKDGTRPLSVCVRSYHGWMNAILERVGFDLWQDQAVMVKHLAATVRKPALARLRPLEGTRPEPTAPFVRIEDTKTGIRAHENS